MVEDDAGWRSILEELLVDAGFLVRTCGSFGDGLGYLRREKISLAVIDLLLNGSVTNLWDQKIPSENLEGYQLLASYPGRAVFQPLLSAELLPRMR